MKIIVEYDTVTKQLSVTQDGAAISDVNDVSFRRKYDYEEDEEVPLEEFGFYLSTMQLNKEEGMTSTTHVSASKEIQEQRGRFLSSLLKQKRIR